MEPALLTLLFPQRRRIPPGRRQQQGCHCRLLRRLVPSLQGHCPHPGKVSSATTPPMAKLERANTNPLLLPGTPTRTNSRTRYTLSSLTSTTYPKSLRSSVSAPSPPSSSSRTASRLTTLLAPIPPSSSACSRRTLLKQRTSRMNEETPKCTYESALYWASILE